VASKAVGSLLSWPTTWLAAGGIQRDVRGSLKITPDLTSPWMGSNMDQFGTRMRTKKTEALWRRLAQQQQQQQQRQLQLTDISITSPTKPIPASSQTNSKIQQRMQLERQQDQEHMDAKKAVKGLVYEFETQVASIMKLPQAQADALRKIEEEKQSRLDQKAEQVAKEQQQQEQLVKDKHAKREIQKAEVEQRKKDKETKSAQATEYVTKPRSW
jgi:hypothetical protein